MVCIGEPRMLMAMQGPLPWGQPDRFIARSHGDIAILAGGSDGWKRKGDLRRRASVYRRENRWSSAQSHMCGWLNLLTGFSSMICTPHPLGKHKTRLQCVREQPPLQDRWHSIPSNSSLNRAISPRPRFWSSRVIAPQPISIVRMRVYPTGHWLACQPPESARL